MPTSATSLSPCVLCTKSIVAGSPPTSIKFVTTEKSWPASAGAASCIVKTLVVPLTRTAIVAESASYTTCCDEAVPPLSVLGSGTVTSLASGCERSISTMSESRSTIKKRRGSPSGTASGVVNVKRFGLPPKLRKVLKLSASLPSLAKFTSTSSFKLTTTPELP